MDRKDFKLLVVQTGVPRADGIVLSDSESDSAAFRGSAVPLSQYKFTSQSFLKVTELATVGGTIDKDYPKRQGGYAFEICGSGAMSVLERCRPTFPFRVVTACTEDSQDLTELHRSQIVDVCRGAEETFILVTHGTDTILQTAAFIAKRLVGASDVISGDVTGPSLPDSDAGRSQSPTDGDAHTVTSSLRQVTGRGDENFGKTVVLTGAFLPERFKDTDADFNVGVAVGAMQGGLGPGVYVSLGGRVWRWDRVTRAKDGRYVSLE
ncbi:hypothetical protein BaRGS_00025211 [Batillaria attramentaria]|uniref:L-asparaginase N-terminal domain-containing protein n=1 Tax=Batillaria attramentaria TaxID=370345 RepID=A0ABD0K8X1_9CAEN